MSEKERNKYKYFKTRVSRKLRIGPCNCIVEYECAPVKTCKVIYIYIYIYVCVCVCVCIYICVYIYTYKYINIYIYIKEAKRAKVRGMQILSSEWEWWAMTSDMVVRIQRWWMFHGLNVVFAWKKNYPLGKRFIIYSLTRRTRVEFVVRLGRKKKENTSEKGRSSSRVSI